MWVLLENTTFSLHTIVRNAGIIRIAGIIRGRVVYEEIRYLENDVLLVSKIFLGYEEALWSKKLKICHVKF